MIAVDRRCAGPILRLAKRPLPIKVVATGELQCVVVSG